MIVGRFLPSRLPYLLGSDRWATLDDDTAFILWLTRIGEDLCLEGRDVAIKLFELGGKGTRLRLFAGFMIKKGRRRR